MLYILYSCALTLSQTFQQFSNPEKYVILIKVTVRFILSPVSGVMSPLRMRQHVDLPEAVINRLYTQLKPHFYETLVRSWLFFTVLTG